VTMDSARKVPNDAEGLSMAPTTKRYQR